MSIAAVDSLSTTTTTQHGTQHVTQTQSLPQQLSILPIVRLVPYPVPIPVYCQLFPNSSEVMRERSSSMLERKRKVSSSSRHSDLTSPSLPPQQRNRASSMLTRQKPYPKPIKFSVDNIMCTSTSSTSTKDTLDRSTRFVKDALYSATQQAEAQSTFDLEARQKTAKVLGRDSKAYGRLLAAGGQVQASRCKNTLPMLKQTVDQLRAFFNVTLYRDARLIHRPLSEWPQPPSSLRVSTCAVFLHALQAKMKLHDTAVRWLADTCSVSAERVCEEMASRDLTHSKLSLIHHLSQLHFGGEVLHNPLLSTVAALVDQLLLGTSPPPSLAPSTSPTLFPSFAQCLREMTQSTTQ